MNKTLKIYGIILFIVVVFIALLELSKKEVTDWRKNFDVAEKTPFGLYIFNQEATSFFGNKLHRNASSPYDYYSEHPQEPHNILIVQEGVDSQSWDMIMKNVTKGSDAMVVSTQLPLKVSDSLGFMVAGMNFDEQQVLKFTDEKFANDFLHLDKFPSGSGFVMLKKNIEILGYTVTEKGKNNACFIKVKFGKGNFYIHTEPLFLTNYYLLNGKNSKKYLENVFSYLPNRKTEWFLDASESVSRNPLSYILSQPALKYAWWILLGGLVLFVFFTAKRKQRKVPLIEPLKNKSVEFVQSVGNLYLQEGDFHDMMSKKAQYFLNKVRMDLMLETQQLDENFAKKLHLKTGTSTDKINEAINLIKKAQDPYASVMKEDLIRMNKLLDEILK